MPTAGRAVMGGRTLFPQALRGKATASLGKAVFLAVAARAALAAVTLAAVAVAAVDCSATAVMVATRAWEDQMLLQTPALVAVVVVLTLLPAAETAALEKLLLSGDVMALYAEVVSGKVRRVVKADSAPSRGAWVDTKDSGAWIGWTYDGTTFSAPPAEYRKVLTGPEWVETWTPTEWRTLKNARSGASGAAEKLDQFLDAIQITNSLDLESPIAVRFYNWLETNGFITAERKAQLTQGVRE